ncbi:unnamed protein product [Diatraea saccharalis]|uniref:Sushi domain-containing protein n=1 Tax=Diatraea saccharalis TaxID=40085 RepID=A0A9N9QTC6_9NEOP|nr:unnamed protein product [Diatraea saccharalis]
MKLKTTEIFELSEFPVGTSRWSSSYPSCVETSCPPLKSVGPHLSVVEYNSSCGGRAVFQCAWGYRLVGAPGLECELDGNWSGETPHCAPIYCPEPLVPEHGRLLTVPKHGQHTVGDLVSFTCDDMFHLAGEASIVCTETGFWSHPPPFCGPVEQTGVDTIYVENSTLVHLDD